MILEFQIQQDAVDMQELIYNEMIADGVFTAADTSAYATPEQPEKSEFDVWFFSYPTGYDTLITGSGIPHTIKIKPVEWSYTKEEKDYYYSSTGGELSAAG